jgi:hypothetical protein
LSGDLRNDFGDDGFRRGGVLRHVGDDHLHRHVRLVHLPAIVVRDHRHRRVGDLCLARTLGLAEVRHADDVAAEFVVGERFGARAELRAFHVHISAAVVDFCLQAARGLENYFP